MMPFSAKTETELDVLVGLKARSRSSLWIVKPSSYCRLPLTEVKRMPTTAIDDALIDAEWHDYDKIWLIDYGNDIHRLRILPSGRLEGSYGILSGSLTAIMKNKVNETRV